MTPNRDSCSRNPTMSKSEALARCEAEIRRCTEYAGPDDLGALLGWVDWEVEKLMIESENQSEEES